MNRYLRLLREPDFRRLWLGATVSGLGDGASWIVLSWLVFERTGSATHVGALVFAYGAPVAIGGLLTGPILDRFGSRRVMLVDSTLRGLIVAAVPVAAAAAPIPLQTLYAVAALYGLLQMVPLVPSLTGRDERTFCASLGRVSQVPRTGYHLLAAPRSRGLRSADGRVFGRSGGSAIGVVHAPERMARAEPLAAGVSLSAPDGR